MNLEHYRVIKLYHSNQVSFINEKVHYTNYIFCIFKYIARYITALKIACDKIILFSQLELIQKKEKSPIRFLTERILCSCESYLKL